MSDLFCGTTRGVQIGATGHRAAAEHATVDTMSATEELRVRNRSLAYLVGGGLSLAVGLLGLVPFAYVPPFGRAAIVLVFAGLGVLVLHKGRKRRTTLIVSADGISWSRPGLSLAASRDKARRVVVRPTRWPLKDPTDYLLEVEVNDRLVQLLVAEHRLFGGPATAKAKRLSIVLGIPFEDSGTTGREWRIVLVTLVAITAVGAIVLLLRS